MNRFEAIELLRAHRRVRLYWLAVLSRMHEKLPEVPLEVLRRAYPIEQALGQLPAQHRRLLGYLYMDKKLYDRQELCDRLAVSEATLYRKRNRALDGFVANYEAQ